MAESGNYSSKSDEKGGKGDKQFTGPCKFCPLSRIGCPMTSFCERIFKR